MTLSTFILQKSDMIAVILAITIVLIACYLIYKYMAIPLYRAQNSGAVSYDELIGRKAVVVSPILEKGFGTISYIVNDNKYNAPAKHLGNLFIEKGQEVIIYKIENNIFYVEIL